ncbi:MAG: FAD-dependent oxidoreductase [Roseovarius sp.]
MSITVIGAGIGGLAAAIALGQRGAQVRVLEQAESIQEVGAGLQISPNGFAVLDALGLGQTVSDRSVQAHAVHLRDYRKGEVLRLDLTRGPHGYHVLHRAVLIHLLAQAARDAGVEIRLGQQVERVRPGTPATVLLHGGETLTADLMIGADGLHSATRPEVTPTQDAFFTGQVAWRAIAHNTIGLQNDIHLYMGPRKHVVLYPLPQNRLNIVAIQEREDWAEEGWAHQADPDDLRAVFADFDADVQAVFKDVQEVNLWGLFRHQVAANWHSSGVAILGDAAHPTLPFMAQGANMALEDAWVLADALDHGTDLSQALAAYQQRRRTRVCRVIEAANANAWKYHLSFPPMRLAAHTVLRVAGRLAPVKVLGQFDWLYHHDVTQAH